jgi:RNA polymerase sigma factor (sigma-70 family)
VPSSSPRLRFAAARNGERWAQEEIVELVSRFARHVCTQLQGSLAAEVGWEDVAQEANRRVFTVGLAQYGGAGSEESYLYTIVKSTLVMIARSSQRRRKREEATAADDPVDRADPHARLEADRILSRLEERCRELLRRVFLEETPYDRLAAELQLAESSVRAKVSRCLGRARELVA